MTICEQKPVKVCFVSPKAYPLFNPDCKGVFGGAEVDLYLLGTELAKDQNFRVTCITADYGQPAEEIRENVTIIRSLDLKRNALEGALRIWRALKKTDADLYMLKTASPGVPLVASFCKLHRRVFIYRTAHQNECDGTYLKQHPILGRMFTRALRQADMVFAQNQSDAGNLKSLHGIDSLAVPNAHRLPDLIEEPDRDVILWVARSVAFKQPRKFLDLAKRFPDEKFVMVCQQATEDSNYDVLKDRAAEISNVEFIERVGFHEVGRYFQRAKVFVNTSDSEGFPNTFIEACKCATAILSLNVDPDDFLTRYSCGICCDNDEVRLADSLKAMLDDQSYMQMGRNAREYAECNHDIEKIVEQYKKLFRELVGPAR